MKVSVGKCCACFVIPACAGITANYFNTSDYFMKHSQTIYCLIVAVLMTVLGGCSSSTHIKTEPVEGIVTLDGAPFEGCSLTLYPAVEGVGDPAYAYTDAKGFYRAGTVRGKIDAGTTPGEYVVGFSKIIMEPTGRKIRDDAGEIVDQMKEVSLVHKNYTSKEKSPWRITVQAGKNRFDFPLKSDGSGPTQ